MITFDCKYPILEACMNKGSTIDLAVAVHKAGGYPSLCSWTYNRNETLFRRDLTRFADVTQSNRVHVSFEFNEYDNQVILDIIKSYHLPTVELIYGQNNVFKDSYQTDQQTQDRTMELLIGIKNLGTKIFKRIYEPTPPLSEDLTLIDGYCIKGLESAGVASYLPILQTYHEQRTLTPDAMLIPYGGIGSALQVKEYMDLGAEIVGVGTLLALSAESPVAQSTKLAAINATTQDLVEFKHVFGTSPRKQSALKFGDFLGNDDANGTIGLVRGLRGKSDGHVYLGHGVNQVTDVRTCQEIINDLVSLL